MPNEDKTVESQVQPTVTAERTVNNELDSFRRSMGLSSEVHDIKSGTQDNVQEQSESNQGTIDSNDEPLNQEQVEPDKTETAEPADESSQVKSDSKDDDLKKRIRELEQENAMQRKLVEQTLSLAIPESKQQKTKEDISDPVSINDSDFEFTPEEVALLENGDTLTAIKKMMSRVKNESVSKAKELTLNQLIEISEAAKKQQSEKQRWDSVVQQFASSYPDIVKEEFAPLLTAATNDVFYGKTKQEQDSFIRNPELYFDEIASKAREYISRVRGVTPQKTTPPPSIISGNNARKQVQKQRELTKSEQEIVNFRESFKIR